MRPARRLLFVAWAVMVLVVAPLPASAAPSSDSVGGVPFEDTFSPQQPGWSFQSPSSGFLGELSDHVNVSSVTLTVTSPRAGPALLEFDLLAFRTLDGFNCCTDLLTFTVNGALAFSGAWGFGQSGFLQNPGNATFSSAGGYRFSITVQLSKGSNTFTWSYSPLQGLADEAWGLDNVSVAPLAAGMTVDRSTGTSPLAVSFDGSASTGPITHYAWDFGDGGTGAGETATHVYTRAGVYTATLRVSDDTGTAYATHRITVVPDVPPEAVAGDDQVVVDGDSVTLDGRASRPSGGIDAYGWDFGDGQSATGARVVHIYAAPGTYTAKLTTTAGSGGDVDEIVVRVMPKLSSPGLAVTVRDDSGALVAEADVVVVDSTGARFPAVTDDEGRATLAGLPDGDYSVYALAPGYLPEVGSATQANGSGEATITLRKGDLATTELESKRLSKEEIVDLGLDPSDPANQNVYEFQVNLCFSDSGSCSTLSGYINEGRAGDEPQFVLPSLPGGECSPEICSFKEELPDDPEEPVERESVAIAKPQVVHGQPSIVWLVIPGKASFLKEFFGVRIVVSNLASTTFSFKDGAATLRLPDGLSLAPTASSPSLTVPMDDIPGQGSRSAEWVVRGDEAGDYDLEAEYSATLDPVGRSVLMSARSRTPLKVWGGGALEMVVDTDQQAWRTYPYRLRVGLKNVTGGDPANATDVYNASVELATEGRVHYIDQPRQRLGFATDVIHPGETFWTDDYVLVPAIDGLLDPSASFVTRVAGNTELGSQIIHHPPVRDPSTTPAFTARAGPAGTRLQWAPAPGAIGYEIYATPAAPGPDDFPIADFPDAPLAVTTATSVSVPRGAPGDWYAVSTLVLGGREMVHAMIQADANLPPEPADDAVATDEDTPLTLPVDAVLANDSDPDGDALALTGVEAGASTHGVVTVSENTIRYAPDADYQGEATFTYSVDDGNEAGGSASVHVTVASVNDAPIARDDAYSTDEDSPLVIPVDELLADDTDVDGDALTVSGVLPMTETHGRLTLGGGNVGYTPDAGYHGRAAFAYTIDDGHGAAGGATVEIAVRSVNDPPDCTAMAADRATLWPPNHRFEPVTLSGATDPEDGRAHTAVAAVVQDEPVDGLGDGDTGPDALRTARSTEVLIRAERSGRGDGRVYRIDVTATDGDGLSCSATIRVGVPHATRRAAVDSGGIFDSLAAVGAR